MERKLLKKFLISILIIFLLLFIYVVILFMPIRFAISPENIDDNKFYVVAKPISSTEYEWSIINENGNAEEVLIDTKMKGNLPNVSYEYSFLNEDNKFVLYGHYEEKTVTENFESAVFYVDEFDVIYPVKHGVTEIGILKNIYSWYISYLDIATDFNFDELKKFFVN